MKKIGSDRVVLRYDDGWISIEAGACHVLISEWVMMFHNDANCADCADCADIANNPLQLLTVMSRFASEHCWTS